MKYFFTAVLLRRPGRDRRRVLEQARRARVHRHRGAQHLHPQGRARRASRGYLIQTREAAVVAPRDDGEGRVAGVDPALLPLALLRAARDRPRREGAVGGAQADDAGRAVRVPAARGGRRAAVTPLARPHSFRAQ